jgi:hypothetical protein
MTLFKLMKLGFDGPLSSWVKLIFGLLVIEVGFLYWALYEFFVAPDIEAQVFWGIIALFLGLMVGLQKIWYWMHLYFLWSREKDSE